MIGKYDNPIKCATSFRKGNTLMRRKGSMRLANMNMQYRSGRAWEMQLIGGKEAWDWPL
jgi:hypothetical protein